jgi:hypothetical protein
MVFGSGKIIILRKLMENYTWIGMKEKDVPGFVISEYYLS